MAWSQSDVDALKAAIVAGGTARSITFSDQSVTFHSVSEMLELLAAMQADADANSANPTNYRLAVTGKGC